MRTNRTAIFWLAAVVVCTASCEVSNSRNPLSLHVAGPIPDVSITAPRPLSLGDGAKIEQDQQPVQVEFENPSTNGERPIALHWQGARLFIQAIEARWRIPGGTCFRVRTQDGRVFELFYGQLYDEWRVHQP